MRSPKSTAAVRQPSAASATRWELTAEIEAELAEIAAASGCELIHAEWKGGVLRLILDRPEGAAGAPEAEVHEEAAAATGLNPAAPPAGAGVSLGDCEHVAKQVSALLDVLDFGNGRFLLEVSSPGLDRQLYRPSDYQRFVGRLARVTYETAANAESLATPTTPAAPTLPAAPLDIAAGPGKHPAAGRRRTVVARLAAFHPAPTDAGLGQVTLADDRTGERLTLRLEDIRGARLEVEL